MKTHNNVWGIAERSLNHPRLRASAPSISYGSSTRTSGIVDVVVGVVVVAVADHGVHVAGVNVAVVVIAVVAAVVVVVFGARPAPQARRRPAHGSGAAVVDAGGSPVHPTDRS